MQGGSHEVGYVRWVIMRGGLSCEVGYHMRWVITQGGLSCEVGYHARWVIT